MKKIPLTEKLDEVVGPVQLGQLKKIFEPNPNNFVVQA